MLFAEKYKSFHYAYNGLKNVWREERNFRTEVLIAILVGIFILYFDFSFVESVFCILAIVMVLMSEIINTAIEDICNKIQPDQDPTIAKLKDISAALVLVSVVGALTVGILVFYHHFLYN